jgi:Cu/Ag efflux pump CusA
MAKYTVAVTETIEYLVPVEGDNEEIAEQSGLDRIVDTADRNKWFVACRAREVEGVNEVEHFEQLPRSEQVVMTLADLRAARDTLRELGCAHAANYVARAMKSVEGAARHARGVESREARA